MPDLRDTRRLSIDQVTAPADTEWFNFETTDALPVIEAIYGQERAVRSIEFGLSMTAHGYNLYAAGPDGIGKSTVVEQFLRRRAEQLPAPLDWVYVHNFQDTDRPVAISLPPGEGRRFADLVKRAVETAGEEIRLAFESDGYIRQRQQLGELIDQERGQLITALQQQAAGMGFALQFTASGIMSAPLIDGEPATEEQFRALPEEEQERLQETRRQLERLLQETLLQIRAIERSGNERLTKLDEDVANYAVGHLFDPLIDQYGRDDEIRVFLEATKQDLRTQRDRFRAGQQQPQAPILPGMPVPPQPSATRRYEVNVLVSNDPHLGAPVIVERHPTYYNLLGRIEYVGQLGTAMTDHTMVRAGSLARANGGYLVLRMRDLLTNPQALDGLKRALTSSELGIENVAEAYGLVPTLGLRPEPIPLNLKVVIIGDAYLYSMLYRYDSDFRELFRVKADFETEVPREPENVRGIASMVRHECERSKLRCFTRDGIARLVEHSSRMVEDQRKLSANLGQFFDIVRQSDFWAGNEGAERVDRRHVDRALDERTYRSALIRDRIIEAIEDGSIYVETETQVVGQINGLSVYDLGDISFGRPSRVTCVTSPGRGAIVMIERESEMAGRIHNKGFLILRGFLTHHFGMDRASSMHASLTFEQLYGDIDGDSASSTELYALLSALSGQPIDQRIAVTGSVDQYGRVQPIGGATRKIEGFYDICRLRGLDGSHGVMIPTANIDNVVLRPDVAEAVRDGRFNVWAVNTIEEGIEILTGTPAGGERDAEGHYAEGTIYRMVEDTLRNYAQQLRQLPPNVSPDGAHVPIPQQTYPTPPGVPPQPPPDPPIIV